jgi:hypothetical protein
MSLSASSQLGQMIGGLSSKQSDLSANISPDDSDPLKQVYLGQTLAHKDRVVIIRQRNIATSAIWDMTGYWDIRSWTESYLDGFFLGNPASGTLGLSLLGDSPTPYEYVTIVCEGNTYIEHFANTLLKGGPTTATWTFRNTSFTSGQLLQTSSIFYDSSSSQTVSSAQLTVAVASGSFDYYLSADGGTNWETVTNGVTHSFSNTGSNLMIKIQENAASTGVINQIVCSYNLI